VQALYSSSSLPYGLYESTGLLLAHQASQM
jgi:hypothetical protein